MNLVNSKDVVADRVRDIHAQAAVAGRPARGRQQRRRTWRGLAAMAGVPGLARPQSIMKAVEEL